MGKARQTKPRYGKSEKLFAEAVTLMPGGVSSPVRSFKSVGLSPVFIKEAKGCRLTDVDQNTYIDYVMSYGPLIAGHAPPTVRAAVAKQIDKGSSYGCSSEAEVRLARMIGEAMPNVPMVRFVNSGTEATMSAIRLARGATKRDIIVKCAGCYHGHVDALLVQAGSGATTHGAPSSPGIPASVTQNTALVPYNDLEAARKIFAEAGPNIAAFLIEAVCGNIGVVLPDPGYLEGLRELCDEHGALLVFDEVMTGFRVALGGAQSLYGVRPDLTCLGKIIGGGLPVGAYGGKRELMEQVSPAGPVYQAGTLSGNPLAMAAGIATLDILEEGGIYTQLEALSVKLAQGLIEAAREAELSIAVQRCGSMLTPFFLPDRPTTANAPPVARGDTAGEVTLSMPEQGHAIRNYADALACDTQAYARFFRVMLDQGAMLPPSQFEAWFVSSAHGADDIDQTLEAAKQAFKAVKAPVENG